VLSSVLTGALRMDVEQRSVRERRIAAGRGQGRGPQELQAAGIRP
jgi:hypothetical protein